MADIGAAHEAAAASPTSSRANSTSCSAASSRGTLGATVGDKVVLIAPQGQVTPAGLMPRLRQFTVVGIFEVDHYEFDSGLALVAHRGRAEAVSLRRRR